MHPLTIPEQNSEYQSFLFCCSYERESRGKVIMQGFKKQTDQTTPAPKKKHPVKWCYWGYFQESN